MNSWCKAGCVVAALCLLTACAMQPPPSTSPEAPGFLQGLFHGVTLPFSLVASFFSEIRIYAYPNAGWPYDLGFCFGAGLILGGGSRAG